MDLIQIKKAGPADLEELHRISVETFREAFAASNTASDMAQYLRKNLSPDNLKAEMDKPDSAFYFATRHSRVIGYLKVNRGPAQTEMQQHQALEIERIYIRKAWQGQKAGEVLLGKALQLARQLQASYIWLGVWEKNTRAIAFYQKHGFVAFDKHLFRLGQDEQTDILMKLAIR